jgi:hypothetical protein
MKQIGKVWIDEDVNKERFIEMIRSLKLKPPTIIKPNLGFSVCFTEAEILDWTLEALQRGCSGGGELWVGSVQRHACER